MKAPAVYLAALIAGALFVSAPFQAAAQEGKPKTEGKEKAKRDVYPYRGTVKSTDKTAMAITLSGQEKDRVITVTSETRITKEGKPATFGDIATGEMVRGQVKKTPEGKENVVSVFLGPVPEKKGGEKKKKAE